MYLTNDEEHALNGEYGNTLATAYRVLVAIGESTDAERLIPIEWAHVSGVNYNTIGDAGLSFLEEIDQKVKVKTSLNPMGFDPNRPYMVREEFKERQMRIVNAYRNMGVEMTLSCIPYEIFPIPKDNAYASIAESNAAVYVNSFLNILTNKESAISALASALSGKAPYSLLRIEELRKPDTRIILNTELMNELDYGLLGYFAGKHAKNSVSIPSLPKEIWNKKALSAGLGTSGSCCMVTDEDSGEIIEYSKRDAEELKGELSNGNDSNIIVFGSPQLGSHDIKRLASSIRGKKFKKRCMIFCARKAYEYVRSDIERLEKAGAEIYSDCCACLTPLIDSQDSVVTNSIKAAYYLKTWNKAKVVLKSMEEIVSSECHDS
ncbi:MAG: aconitase X catalytic domain-containing protein [Candidatus Nitrosocaldaceae archaeon]